MGRIILSISAAACAAIAAICLCAGIAPIQPLRPITSTRYAVDQKGRTVTGVAHGTTVEEFLSGFDAPDKLRVIDIRGKQVDPGRVVRSGMKVRRRMGSALTVLVNQAAPKAPAGSVEAALVAGTDQKDHKIVVYRMDADWNNAGAIAWQWKPTAERGFRKAGKFAMPSEAKLRYSAFYGGHVAIVTASGGMFAIVDYQTQDCLYSRVAEKGSNPHSIELLPDGNLVVAASDGNSLTVYAASQGDSGGYFQSVVLHGAHGVSWDPGQKILWALGSEQLCGYRIKGTPEQPLLVPAPTLIFDLPAPEEKHAGGHDLFPVYGSEHLYWVTTGWSVYQFDTSTGLFNGKFPGHEIISAENVKSIGTLPGSRSVIRAVPNGTVESWCTNTADLFYPNAAGGYTHETRVHNREAYYKLRVWHDAYH